jgi:HSP20 family molecular chaperone IbpA
MAIQLHRPHAWPALTDWFEDFPFGLRRWPDAQMIRVEEYQQDGTYTVKAELPGIDPDKDLEITVADRMLTIRAERSEEKKEGKRSEFHYGSLIRSVQLPAGTKEDDIKASYDNGVLTVTAPTGSVEEHTKKISISKGT